MASQPFAGNESRGAADESAIAGRLHARAFSGNQAPLRRCSQRHTRCDTVAPVIIAFLGTKGGTGTTTMAVNCAAEIRRLSHRPTLIVDAKPGPGDVAVFLGLRPRYSIVELIDQLGWSERALASRYVVEHTSGLHVLAASEAFGRPNSRDVEGVERALGSLASLYEFVVVDAGSTLTSSAVAALTAADLVVLVANPDLPCLRNMQRLGDALRLAGVVPERMRVLLNRTADEGVLPLSHIETAVGRSMDFQISSDYRTVAAAVNTGVPISSLRRSDLHEQLESMARSIIGLNLRTAVS
jgi:pilus assembly protein CpaE